MKELIKPYFVAIDRFSPDPLVLYFDTEAECQAMMKILKELESGFIIIAYGETVHPRPSL